MVEEDEDDRRGWPSRQPVASEGPPRLVEPAGPAAPVRASGEDCRTVGESRVYTVYRPLIYIKTGRFEQKNQEKACQKDFSVSATANTGCDMYTCNNIYCNMVRDIIYFTGFGTSLFLNVTPLERHRARGNTTVNARLACCTARQPRGTCAHHSQSHNSHMRQRFGNTWSYRHPPATVLAALKNPSACEQRYSQSFSLFRSSPLPSACSVSR